MATAIRVVLQDEMATLGDSGDVVKVRTGFARNYLFPRGIAVPATDANLARVGELKKAAVVRVQKQLENAKLLAKQLQSTAVKLERAVGDENKMYGSVTAKDIEEAFAALGLEIDRRKLDLPDPIRRLGLTEVPLKLHQDVSAVLRVEVVKKT